MRLVRKNNTEQTHPERTCIPDFDVLHQITIYEAEKDSIMHLRYSYKYSNVCRLPSIHSLVLSESLKPY